MVVVSARRIVATKEVDTDSYIQANEQIKEHHRVGKELSSRLRNSTREERQHLHTAFHDELFKRFPHHPQLNQKFGFKASAWVVAQRMQFTSTFLKPDSTFLEVGHGDCKLSLEIVRHVRKVYTVNVSNEIINNYSPLENFELIISDGQSIPVPENNVNIIYSRLSKLLMKRLILQINSID